MEEYESAFCVMFWKEENLKRNYILIRRRDSDHDIASNMLDLPGGGKDIGEKSAKDTVEREVIEELPILKKESLRLKELAKYQKDNSHLVIYFEAEISEQLARDLLHSDLSEEHTDLISINAEEAMSLLDQKLIVCLHGDMVLLSEFGKDKYIGRDSDMRIIEESTEGIPTYTYISSSRGIENRG